MSLGIRSDGGGEIGDAKFVVLLRRVYSLLSLGEIGCGIFDRDLIVARIEVHQRLSLLHVVGVLDVNVDDSAVDARAYWIEMAIDFGIVGPFVGLRVIPETQPACRD